MSSLNLWLPLWSTASHSASGAELLLSSLSSTSHWLAYFLLWDYSHPWHWLMLQFENPSRWQK